MCPKAVAIIGSRFFNSCSLLWPFHVRNFPFFAFMKVLGVVLKQDPWRYWISSVFVLDLVMTA